MTAITRSKPSADKLLHGVGAGLNNDLTGLSSTLTISTESASGVANLSNLDQLSRANVHESIDALKVQLSQHLDNISFEGYTGKELLGESLKSGPAMDAAAVVAMALRNPSAYHHAALHSKAQPASGVNLVSVENMSDFGYTDRVDPSMEAFDNSTLTEFAGLSLIYSLKTGKQDAFGEAFYRTVVLTPELGGLDMTVRSQLVLNHFTHNLNGDQIDPKQRRLLEAAINHNILADSSTTLVPEVHDDNASFFLPEADYDRRPVELGNRTVITAPIKVGQRVNLIAIAQNTLSKKVGVATREDTLDRTTGLKTIQLQLSDGDVLEFDVTNLPRANFNKNPEGAGRVQELQFRNSSLKLTKNSVNYKGEPLTAPILQQIINGGYTVTLSVALTGEVDTEFANAHVDAAPVRVASVKDASGTVIPHNVPGVGKDIADGLAQLAVVGWEPLARLSNANRRLRGLQLNVSTYTERYPVFLGAPLSMPSPLAEQRDASDIDLLVTAARLRNSNNAVTKLVKYAEDLERWIDETGSETNQANDRLPELEGIARFLVLPFFRRTKLDLRKVVRSLKTHERVQDIQAAIVNVLRNDVFDGLIESNYQTALDSTTGYSGQKPKVLIGTDPKVSRFIIVNGDQRTLGDDVVFDKVNTMDLRVRNSIYWTFVREGEGADFINFGSHLWIPELISHVTVSRGESQIREAMVQTRSRHVNHLPILGLIEIEGLAEVLSEGWKIPVENFPGDATGEDAPEPGGPGNPVDPDAPGGDSGQGAGG